MIIIILIYQTVQSGRAKLELFAVAISRTVDLLAMEIFLISSLAREFSPSDFKDFGMNHCSSDCTRNNNQPIHSKVTSILAQIKKFADFTLETRQKYQKRRINDLFRNLLVCRVLYSCSIRC